MAESTSSSTCSTSSLADHCDILEELSEVPEVTDRDSCTSAVSLLNRLRSLGPSELSRKRKYASNSPTGTQRSRGGTSNCESEPKSIKPEQHIREYPNEPLNNALYCRGCREELCMKSSSIKSHCHSAKH